MRVVTVARKPCSASSTVSNVVEWHVGALAIDACRIPGEPVPVFLANTKVRWGNSGTPEGITVARTGERSSAGRWPANVILRGGSVVAELDEQSGISGSGTGVRRKARPGEQPFRTDRGWNQHSMTRDGAAAPEDYGDSGTASRYFKQVKP